MSRHVHRVHVAWGECDAAAIAYYPRFFDWFHQAMETWFADALGMPYAEVILGRRIGFPTVHAEADFQRPCRLGETIDVVLGVERVGGSSLTFAYEVRGEDGLKGTGRVVCAVVDLGPPGSGAIQATRLPDDLRAAIDAFVG